MPARISAYAAGLPIIPPTSAESYTDTPSFSHITNCLHLFDAYLLGRWDVDDTTDDTTLLDALKENGFGSTLVMLCCVTDVMSRSQDAQHLRIAGPYLDLYASLSLNFHVAAHKCMEAALRVLINLTHDSSSWCQASIGSSTGLPSILRLLATFHRQKVQSVAAEPSQHEDEDEAANYLDRLCLILGLITNLVQTSEESKERIRELGEYRLSGQHGHSPVNG